MVFHYRFFWKIIFAINYPVILNKTDKEYCVIRFT